MAVEDWSTTADENTEIDEINIGEHCPLRNINDAIRAIMAAVAAKVAAIASELAAKAPLNSPALTGSPTAPTPAANNDSARIATTEWVNGKIASHTHGNITNDGKLGTASRAVVTDGNKKVTVSSVTATELGYVSGVTSAIQPQLNGKAAKRTFSSTPVYTETFAAATTATSEAPYILTAEQFGDARQELYIHMAVPAAAAASTGRLRVTYANGAKKLGGVSNAIYTGTRYVSWRVRNDCGMADIEAASGNGAANVVRFANTSAYDPIFCNGTSIVKLEFWLTTSGATQFPAGTVIRVFAAS